MLSSESERERHCTLSIAIGTAVEDSLSPAANDTKHHRYVPSCQTSKFGMPSSFEQYSSEDSSTLLESYEIDIELDLRDEQPLLVLD